MTKTTIYGIITNGGDGSASLSWYTDKSVVDHLLNDDGDGQDQDYGYLYGMNEGTPAVTLTLDSDFDFYAAGIYYIDGNSTKK